MRRTRLSALVAVAGACSACGSAPVSELPPPAAPAASPPLVRAPAGRLLPPGVVAVPARDPLRAALGDGRVAVLDPRARAVRLHARGSGAGPAAPAAPAGVGPTHVAAFAGRVYVVDTRGGALLVYAVRPRLRPVRRVYLPGSPYAIAVDPVRRRLWVALTARNVLVELAAHGRPHPLQELPAIRGARRIAVSGGRLLVAPAAGGPVQAVDADRVDGG
jgi:DNA-binding beta-propeller fold protein YncE